MSKSEETKPKELHFHFLKTAGFRTIFCDGVFGGVRPDGSFYMTMYAERPPIPNEVVLKVNPDGAAEEIVEERITKKGMICDVEANVIFNLETAIELHAWLEENLNAAVSEGLADSEDDCNLDCDKNTECNKGASG